MKLKINPTRMELLRLRRRLEMAKRGHKLLKDKLDGLIQRFLKTIKEEREIREKLEPQISKVFISSVLDSANMWGESLEEAVMMPKQRTSIDLSKRNIMGVYIPLYSLKIEGDFHSYGMAGTPAELDEVLAQFSELLPDLIKLAGHTKMIEILSKDIAEIRRRVNALEHILIPELESAQKFIRMKLSEMERGYLTSLMKIKDIVRAR